MQGDHDRLRLRAVNSHSVTGPLSGLHAVVTGASRGIGAAIAKALARAGVGVTALSRSGGSDTESIRHVRLDLSDGDKLQDFAAELFAAPSRLDILVNAAAISMPLDREAGPVAELQRMRMTLEVDVIAPYALSLAAVPLLKESPAASIINVTSINSIQGFPGNPPYVAAKSALSGLTRALAVDLAPMGIRVNSIAPGYVRTAMTEKSYSDPELNAQRRRHTLLDRWGNPEEIADVAVFLASDASSYMTGQELVVDGGWTINGLMNNGDR